MSDRLSVVTSGGFFFSPFPEDLYFTRRSHAAAGWQGEKNLRNVSSNTTSLVAPVNSSEYVSISCAHPAVFYFAANGRKKIHPPARGKERERESGTRARKLYFLWKKCCVFRAVRGRASVLFVQRAKRASPIAASRALSTRQNCATDWRELSANALQTLPFVRIE